MALRFWIFVIPTLVSACAMAAAGRSGETVYETKVEADEFLANRDGEVQRRQIAAILAATAGRTNDLGEVRSARNAMAPLPDGVEAEALSPKMRLYRPKGVERPPLLVYLHGGGWVIGSIASCSAFCGELAAKGVAVLALDYPLAPEHPYPAALEMVCATLRGIRDEPARFHCDPRRVSVGGDSAGGNLALAAALALQDEGIVPYALVLYYPVVEARADGTASWRRFATGFGMDAAFMDACCAAYLQGRSPEDPLVSPLLASDDRLGRLPPVHVLGADRDVLRDQGLAFYGRMKGLRRRVRWVVQTGTTHLFVTVPGQPTAFRRAVEFAAEALTDEGLVY